MGAVRRQLFDRVILQSLYSERDSLIEADLSPDGRYVSLLIAGRTGPHLVLRDGGADGFPGRRLTLPFDVTAHAWHPDGRWLAVTGHRRTGGPVGVTFVPVDGNGLVDRTPPAAADAPLMIERGVRRIGGVVVAVGRQDTAGATSVELYGIEPDGPPTLLGPAADLDRWFLDRRGRLRAGVRWELDGSMVVLGLDETGTRWHEVHRLAAPDALLTHPQELDGDGRTLLLSGPFGGPHLRFGRLDLGTGETNVEVDWPGRDIDEVVLSPSDRRPALLRLAGPRPHYVALDEQVRADISAIRVATTGDFGIEATSADDQVWLLRVARDRVPDRIVRWDRRTRRGQDATPGRRQSVRRPSRTLTFCFTASDGMRLEGYLTLPRGVWRPAPTVLLVHGGPWARDDWAFNADRHWLVRRGFAVVQVQFRGSEGRGVDFLAQADRDWGGRMQQDLIDARQWAVAEGYADPRRVSIMGTSYGGYAALAAATLGPPVFAAAVSICGAADLVALADSFTTGRSYLHALFLSRLGHPDRDREMLRERSPLTHAAGCHTPVFLAHGLADPLFDPAQSYRMAEALERHGHPHELLCFDDEGHGVSRAANRITLACRIDRFLSAHARSATLPLE